MSIFFDFEIGPTGRRFRRAVQHDKSEVECLINEETKKIFGDLDIGALLELSVLSICMINEENEVLGFMCLNDYPNVHGVDPNDWEVWVRNMFQKYYVSRNTLFIHYACCKETVIDYYFEEALLSVFENDTYLLQIVLLVTGNCNVDNLLRNKTFKKRKMFRHLTRRQDDSETSAHYMYVAQREDFCPKLHIRSAVEEDNDDIVQILDKTSPRLTEMYGYYYISELVGCHRDGKRKIIVAESQERAVGVMCLSSDINYRKLQNIYELKPWFGLKKATPLEKEQLSRNNVLLGVFGEPIMRGVWGPYDDPPEIEIPGRVAAVNKKKRKTKRRDNISLAVSKVLFKEENNSIEIMEHDYKDSNDYSDVISVGSILSNQSVELLLKEEEPFDYDIVNIDKELLTLPMNLSFDFIQSNVNLAEKRQLSNDHEHRPLPFIKPKSQRSKKNKKSEYQIYEGQPNAFCIELFGLREDIDPKYKSFFEAWYVPTKRKVCCRYSMFIAHRSSVLGKLRVRAAEIADIPNITRLLQTVQCKDTICTIENRILKNDNTIYAYVFMSGLSVIGLGILDVPDRLNFILARYCLELFHNNKYHLPGQDAGLGFSSIKTMVAYPAFEVHYRFFAREMMRLSGSNCLIWMTAYKNKWVANRANSITSAMIPLAPRKAVIEVAPVPELKFVAAMERNIPPFSSWFLDKKLTSVPLITVSTRIVIVGASRTAMGFINALIFDHLNTYLCFTGITLISPNGLPYLKRNNTAADAMFPKHNNMTDKYLKCVPYTYYVNVIFSSMTDINRQEKYITLTNGNKYYYDILILTIGKQHQHPDYLRPATNKETTMREDCSAYLGLDTPRERIVPELANYKKPDNVFFINDLKDANTALRYVRSTYSYDNRSTYIVYGATIDAYCCLTGLLESNIPPKNIIFVEPFPSEDRFKTRISPFNNCNVDDTVNNVIENLGIKVYRSYYFKSWSLYEDTVIEVDFLSKFHLAKLDCTALFYYGKRQIDTKAYIAVNNCGMGYDGGILVDHQYRTKDPCIYAAGPCTAYYRRYFATDKKQKYFDSVEVGQKLGHQIRNQYDPLFTDKPNIRRSSVRFSTESNCDSKAGDIPEFSTKKSSITNETEKAIDKIPTFTNPKVIYCRLPGGLQYLDVRSPGKKIPHPYLQSLDYSGLVLETFKNGYFKLHMQDSLIVNAITCLTNEKYNLYIFKHIYGLPSAVLNHVYLKYMTKKLDNFYEFFRSPWAYFLYHDQCDELFAMVKELLPKGQPDGDTVLEALHKIRMSISSSTRDSTVKNEIKNRFDATPHIQTISEYVIEWLEENDITMTMYLQPSHLPNFLHDLERNCAFKKKKTSITNLISNNVL